MNRAARTIVLVFLAVLVAAALLNGYFLPLAGRRVRPEHVASPIVFIAFVLWQFSRRTSTIRLDFYAGLSAAWVVINLIASWTYAPDRSESFVHVVRMGFLAAAFLTVSNLPPLQPSEWARRVRVWLVLASIDLAYGVVVWLFARYGHLGLPGAYYETGIDAISIKGTQVERNLLGIFAATLLPMAVYWLAAQRKAKTIIAARALLITTAALSSIVLVVSMTRSAWIAVVAAGPVVYLLFDRRWIPRADRPLVSAMAAVPVVFGLTFALVRFMPGPNLSLTAERGATQADTAAGSTLSHRLSTLGRLDSDFTVNTRVQDARWAIEDWRASPWIGRGTGSFAQIHGIRVGSEAWVSNLVLHTLVDTGLAGLIIQCSLFLLVAVGGWRAAAHTTDPALAIGLRAMVVGLFVMLIAYQVTDGSWMALFWIHLGLIVNGIYCAQPVS